MAPTSNLPLFYFGVAHASLAAALAVLVAAPALPGPFFFHPRMMALIHLLTVGWLSGSILGAFYIVGPLVLRMPLPVGRTDWVLAMAFTGGVSGLAWHAWQAQFDSVAWSAVPVGAAFAWLGLRAALGLRTAVVPWPVALHVALAFANLLAAVLYAGVIAWDKARGALGYSPMLLAFAHAHLAAVGWAVMMVVGIGYRLIPMFLPSAMPSGATPAWSAVLIEAGLIIVVLSLPAGHWLLPAGALLIVAGLLVFARILRRSLRRPVPRPPALPARDWSLWQSFTALGWLAVAVVSGMLLTLLAPSQWTVRLMWVYGVAGLVGFLAQMVVGMQGRLVPMYVWYRAWARRPGPPPEVAANALPASRWARPIFGLWCGGMPVLVWGLAAHNPGATRVAAGLLLAGVLTNAAYLASMLRRATPR